MDGRRFALHPCTTIDVDGLDIIGRIPELVVPFDASEFAHWREARCSLFESSRRPHSGRACVLRDHHAADLLLDSLDDGGLVMGRPRSVYYHQASGVGRHRAGYNFPEAKLGVLLIERSYAPQAIVYENWRVSAGAAGFKNAAMRKSEPGLVAKGTALVSGCFKPEFFDLMSKLLEVNGVNHEATVDVFAWNRANGECGFFEAKHHDPLARHQKLLLASVAYLTQCQPAAVLHHPKMVVRTGVVRFDAKATAPREDPCAHSVSFRLPVGWSF
jgi:hypothetical protein